MKNEGARYKKVAGKRVEGPGVPQKCLASFFFLLLRVGWDADFHQNQKMSALSVSERQGCFAPRGKNEVVFRA